MKPSIFTKPILFSLFALIVQSSLLAQEMSRGTMLLSAFCLDTYGTEQTNITTAIDRLCEREQIVSGFAISFGQAECTSLQTNISFCATNDIGQILENAVVVTNLEENETFERARFSWESSSLGEKLDLCVLVTADFQIAKQALLTELGGMQSTMMLPIGTNELDHLGDICYGKLSSFSLVFCQKQHFYLL